MADPFISIFTYGGGLRGIVPATVMTAIEERTGLPLAYMVDLFCGPSSGSILNAAITRRHRRNPNRPQYTARQMIYFYEREGANIFPPDRYRAVRGIIRDVNNKFVRLPILDKWIERAHYNERSLAKCLFALYGDARMGESLSTLAVPYYSLAPSTQQTGLAAGGAQWFLHVNEDDGIPTLPETKDVTLYDAVMASTAAPTYFPAHAFTSFDPKNQTWQNYQGIDGSVFDSPAISYLSLIKPMLAKDREVVYITLGTGLTNPAIDKADWDKWGALGLVDPANNYPLINVLMTAADSALAAPLARDLKDNLFSFNRPLYGQGPNAPSTALDDGTPENLQRLKRFGEELVEDSSAKIDRLCHILVSTYDRRKKRGF